MIITYTEYCSKLNEGLIKTYNINNFKNYLEKYLENIFPQEYYNIEIIKDDYKLIFDLSNKTFINNKEKKIFFNGILSSGYYMGYFPSYIWIKLKNNFEYHNKFTEEFYYSLLDKDILELKLRFESKFDDNENYTGDLYHVVNILSIGKILQKGLVPKTLSKKSNHPPRIYFYNNISDTINLIPQLISTKIINTVKFDEHNSLNDFVILKYKSNDIKLYSDPNSTGYYIYDNVYKDDLTIEKLFTSNEKMNLVEIEFTEYKIKKLTYNKRQLVFYNNNNIVYDINFKVL